MKRLVVFAMILSLAAAVADSVPAKDPLAVSDSVVADWIEQDRLKGGKFDLAHSREILERGEKLLADLAPALDRTLCEPMRGELRAAAEQLAAAAGRETSLERRRQIYLSLRTVVRRIAFANPLLDFDKLLVVKRHPGRFPHMCDQYYGTYARPGGGLVILENLWTTPTARELVGRQLPSGSFLSPDLTFDGRQVAFAYCQQMSGVDYETLWKSDADSLRLARWTADVRYHLFKVTIDGSDLVQLTDAAEDDFDPCWLPDGRLIFISTRRGGHCRCGGRPVPAYTLHELSADGKAIRRLSSHETNEWHPVLSNDGRVLYTRWDYVDRHTNLAHSLWSSNADGSNPVAVFGNYNWQKKPWGEWHPQPIPGSHKLLAIAGAHHGYASGSLVLIDPAKAPDGAGAITRLTPDVTFPEAEGFPGHAFTTPWALDESYYLVAYSPKWSTRDASHQIPLGIYLIDRFGNRELLYRDPAIACETPIPVRPRPAPPVYAPLKKSLDRAEGEFLIVSAYASSEPIAGQIKKLRIVQILPKTTFVSDRPKVSAARQVSARMLLGTVPVEADGSAYFKAPAGVPLYFQVVDEQGFARQSMRTITYLQPGEKRTCSGCHEPRHTAPPNHLPLAARRAASVIAPGPEGTRPFSYQKLVQPVLDRYCVECHNPQKPEGKVVLTGTFASPHAPHTISYQHLAKRDLVHWFDSVNGGEWLPRTYPDQFGARQSKLLRLLRDGHYGAPLDAESLERLAVWIDLNVPFYGVYEPEHVALQRAGKPVPIAELVQ